MRKPAPRSENSRIAARRFRAISREDGVGRDQEVGVGAAVRAAHAAAELVELGEPVAVGPVDDEGVGARDVEAVLDDGGGHEDVGPALHEGEHRPSRARASGIWPWATATRASGTRRCTRCGQGVDGLDAVVDEVDLAVARQLLPDGGRDRRPSRT